MISFKRGIKYLYRPLIFVNKGVSSVDYIRFENGVRHYFSVDFPALYQYMLRSKSLKINQCNGITLHMYKDKYRNIVVRYYES